MAGLISDKSKFESWYSYSQRTLVEVSHTFTIGRPDAL